MFWHQQEHIFVYGARNVRPDLEYMLEVQDVDVKQSMSMRPEAAASLIFLWLWRVSLSAKANKLSTFPIAS